MGLPPCGTDSVHQALFPNSPSYFSNKALFDSLWHQDPALNSSDSLPIYTIPVVVHVIHRGSQIGEEENISDAQILSAIHALNEDFRRVAGSNGEGSGVDVFVQFELAHRSPEDLPTTGIVRVDGSVVPGYTEHGIAAVDVLPGADQVAVKSLSSWLGDDYLNVFVVPEINGNNGGGGIQGFAYTAPTGDVRDGVTLLYNVIGTVGTLKPERTLNRTLTHEVGHHFSLLHTFADTDDCEVENNCNTSGDEVCDTPVTLENSSCTSGTCPNAQLENYMDYTPTSCRNAFTHGQRARMRMCLETVRSSLLESLGTQPVVGVDLKPVAVNQASVCTPTWQPFLSIQNQGAQSAHGFTVQWSVQGIPLSPLYFSDSIPAGFTLNVPLTEMLLPAASTSWEFIVVADDALDEVTSNDTLSHTLTYTPNDAWTLTIQTDFFANETNWSVVDSAGTAIWSGGDYPLGANTYVHQACVPPGCYSLVVTDSGEDGLALGGSLILENALGDTLAHIVAGTNFGGMTSIDVCADTPFFYNSWTNEDPVCPSDNTCLDFNLNGLCDDEELVGCTYLGAPNFSPQATLDDGTCLPACPGDLNGDGFVQATDLLEFLAVFGLQCGP